jgi:hypothetical protein
MIIGESHRPISLPTKRSLPTPTNPDLIKVNKVGYRKLASGKIVKNLDEQYLRKEMACGISSCPFCEKNHSKFPPKIIALRLHPQFEI